MWFAWGTNSCLHVLSSSHCGVFSIAGGSCQISKCVVPVPVFPHQCQLCRSGVSFAAPMSALPHRCQLYRTDVSFAAPVSALPHRCQLYGIGVSHVGPTVFQRVTNGRPHTAGQVWPMSRVLHQIQSRNISQFLAPTRTAACVTSVLSAWTRVDHIDLDLYSRSAWTRVHHIDLDLYSRSHI